jgi:stearoyl-CoA desaturase (delta-9 desaturase)
MWEKLNVPMTLYLVAIHGSIAGWLLFGSPCKWQTHVWAFLLLWLGGLGITAGAHRLWAHRSYKAHAVLRAVLMFFNSIANQGTIYHWARDHRVHHVFSDTPADPYDATRGFFFSHCGWLMLKKHSAVMKACKKHVNLSDLEADSLVQFQKTLDPVWNFFWCFAFPALVAHACWDESWKNALLVAGVGKYVWLLHCTWCVNSIVHKYGPKPYQAPPASLPVPEEKLAKSTYHRDNVTTESPLVSLLAFGEGWHSWHHAFPWDYATSELGALKQYNPTKMFIDFMHHIGLVSARKRATEVWEIRKREWLNAANEAKTETWKFVESLSGFPLFNVRKISAVRKKVD